MTMSPANGGEVCRDAWARESSRAKDAAGQTYIAQTLRNSITAASLLATACSLIAVTGVGNIILDEQKLSMLENIVVGCSKNVTSSTITSIPPLPQTALMTQSFTAKTEATTATTSSSSTPCATLPVHCRIGVLVK